MPYKPVITQLLDLAQQAQGELVARLSEQERQARGELKDWAFKEITGHIMIWIKRRGDDIPLMKRGEQPVQYDNYQELNDQNFEEFRQMTWEQMQAYAAQVWKDYKAAFQTLSEAELAASDLFENQRAPLWNQIVGIAFVHPITHYADVYIRRGDIAQADRLQEKAAQILMELDAGDVWQGTVHYNLACHYSLTGRKEKAIDLLRQALPLNPGLVEWSKQDSDLDSLREEAAFQALYEGVDESTSEE